MGKPNFEIYYTEYSTGSAFDLPTQNIINVYRTFNLDTCPGGMATNRAGRGSQRSKCSRLYSSFETHSVD
jgi:hypothetical protein